jgi:hypothetical protein
MDRDKMSNLYRGLPIDASYHVSVHFSPLKPLGQMNRNLVGSIYGRFSLKIAKLTDDGRQMMTKAHLAKGRQGDLKTPRY